jgi:hypothetical protein
VLPCYPNPSPEGCLWSGRPFSGDLYHQQKRNSDRRSLSHNSVGFIHT